MKFPILLSVCLLSCVFQLSLASLSADDLVKYYAGQATIGKKTLSEELKKGVITAYRGATDKPSLASAMKKIFGADWEKNIDVLLPATTGGIEYDKLVGDTFEDKAVNLYVKGSGNDYGYKVAEKLKATPAKAKKFVAEAAAAAGVTATIV